MSPLERFGVHAGEEQPALLVGALTLLLAAGAGLGGSAMDALLYTRFGTSSLPLLYVGLGLTSILSTLVLTAALARGNRGRLYTGMTAGIAAALVIGRLALVPGAPWVYPAIWLAVSVILTAQGLLLWGLAGLVCDSRQAKRLFPIFGAAGVLGTVIGGLGTSPLAAWLGAENLLLVWSVLALGAFACGRALMKGVPVEPAPEGGSVLADMRQGYSVTRRTPLLGWLLLAAIMFSILYYALAFPFSQAAAARFTDADRLAGFLGIVQAAWTGAAFVASLALANRVYTRLGLAWAVLMLPLIYLSGFVVLLLVPAFTVLVGFRFLQMAWMLGVAGSAYHALFNVVPSRRRDQARSFVDGVGTQAGTLLGGLVLVAGQRGLPAGKVYAVGAAAALLTAFACWMVGRRYTAALGAALREGQPDVFASSRGAFGRATTADASAIARLREALADADPGRRRLAALMAASLEPSQLPLEPLLRDPDDGVALAAAAGVLRAGGGNDVEETLREALRSEDRAAACLGVLALAPCPSLRPDIESAAGGGSAPVRRAAVNALSRLADTAPEALAPFLGDPATRAEAVAGLAARGTAARPSLLAALASPATEDGALQALVESGPGADRALIGYRDARSSDAVRLLGFRESCRAATVESGDRGARAQQLLAASLDRAARRQAVRSLRAMVAITGGDTLRRAIAGLDSPAAEQRASALEALESGGHAPTVRPLLPIWEPGPARSAEDGWLAAVIREPDPWLQACGRYLQELDTSPDVIATLADMERILFLRGVAIFADLDPGDLAQIAAVAVEALFEPGAVIVRQSEPGDQLFVIVSGEVTVTVDGLEVARRRTGEVIGEMAVLTGEPRAATLTAAERVRVLRLDRAHFETILRERPGVGLGVIRVLAGRLREAPRPR